MKLAKIMTKQTNNQITLWTIQPSEVVSELLKTGSFVCDANKSEYGKYFQEPYNWMTQKMVQKIGPPPSADIQYPVWAWARYNGEKVYKKKHQKLVLGYCCIEFVINKKDVLLTDVDAWTCILNHMPVTETEEEFDQIFALKGSKKEKAIQSTWNKAFDIARKKNNWTVRGENVQATFWVLKREWIRKIISVSE